MSDLDMNFAKAWISSLHKKILQEPAQEMTLIIILDEGS